MNKLKKYIADLSKIDLYFCGYSIILGIATIPILFSLDWKDIKFGYPLVIFFILRTISKFFSFSLYKKTRLTLDLPLTFGALGIFSYNEFLFIMIFSNLIYYTINTIHKRKYYLLYKAIFLNIFNATTSILIGVITYKIALLFMKLPLDKLDIKGILQLILVFIIFEIINLFFIIVLKLLNKDDLKHYFFHEKWVYLLIDVYLFPVTLLIIITYLHAHSLGITLLFILLIQILIILKDLLITKADLSRKFKQVNYENKLIKLANQKKIDYDAFFGYITKFANEIWTRNNLLLTLHKEGGITKISANMSDFYISRKVFPEEFFLFIISYVIEHPVDFINLKTSVEINDFFDDYFKDFLSNFQNILIIPIFHFEKLFGLFLAFEYKANEIDDVEIESYMGLLNKICLILDNLYFYQDMEKRIYEKTKELKEKNLELVEVNRQLVEASEAKNNFFAKISHDLKTPLNAIIGFSDMMLGGFLGDLTEGQKEALEKISKAGNRLLKLVKDILDISKFNGHQIKINKTNFNIVDLCDEIINEFYPIAMSKNTTIRLASFKNEVDVYADVNRVKQVIINLIDNAIKYSPNNSNVILGIISGKSIDLNDTTHILNNNIELNDRVVVYVKDFGLGIGEDMHFDIFNDFTQLNNNSLNGIGLGLPIVKKIVDFHNEDMYLKSAAGEGSTFYFTLMLAR